jgi:hypothetical protein
VTTPITFPQPTDPVLIGYTDVGRYLVGALQRAAVTALLPAEGDTPSGLDPDTGQIIYVRTYYVMAVGEGQQIMVHESTDRDQRKQWLQDNAAAWLNPTP